eukprot:gene34525-44628_t
MAKNLFAPVTELWDEPKSPTVKLIDTQSMSTDLKKSTEAANEHGVGIVSEPTVTAKDRSSVFQASLAKPTSSSSETQATTIDELTAELENCKSRLAMITEIGTNDLNSLQSKLDRAKEKLEKADAEKVSMRAELESLKSMLGDLQQENLLLKTENDSLQQQLDEAQRRKDGGTNDTRDVDGFISKLESIAQELRIHGQGGAHADEGNTTDALALLMQTIMDFKDLSEGKTSVASNKGDAKEIAKLKNELSKVKKDLAEKDRQLSAMMDARNKTASLSSS